MISMTWIPEFIRGAVWVYIAVWAGFTVAAWMVPKTLTRRGAALLLVTTAFGALPAYFALSIKQDNDEKRPIVEQRKAQYEAAMARFEERCKTAGEKVYRTVEDVEGVLLTNIRLNRTDADRHDPDWPNAGLPTEHGGEEYIRNFLYWEQHEDKRTQRGFVNYSPSAFPGYRFVDVVADGGGYQRVTLVKPLSNELKREIVTGKPARFAVGFTNFVDPEDRKLWVAGTKVTITDTFTNEVIAEKTWYSVEPGQGSKAGARTPWGFAKTCPFQPGWSGASTRFFVDQILKPKKGE
jgi:hypothetical protein